MYSFSLFTTSFRPDCRSSHSAKQYSFTARQVFCIRIYVHQNHSGRLLPLESINAVEYQVTLCHHLTPVFIVLTREMSQTHTTDLITLTEYGTLRAPTRDHYNVIMCKTMAHQLLSDLSYNFWLLISIYIAVNSDTQTQQVITLLKRNRQRILDKSCDRLRRAVVDVAAIAVLAN